MRADRAFGVDLRGTTDGEALAGPSLDQALARERREERVIDETAAEVVDDGVSDVEGELVTEGLLVRDDFKAIVPPISVRVAGRRRAVDPRTPESSDRDDDLPSSPSRLKVADRFGYLAQRERLVDDRRELPGFDELFQDHESVSRVLGAAEGMQMAHEG